MPAPPTPPHDPAAILARVCNALAAADAASARATLQREYPFQPIQREGREYTELQQMQVFLRDGFIDRYSGTRLVNPAVLRLLSLLLPDDLPAHPKSPPWRAPTRCGSTPARARRQGQGPPE